MRIMTNLATHEFLTEHSITLRRKIGAKEGTALNFTTNAQSGRLFRRLTTKFDELSDVQSVDYVRSHLTRIPVSGLLLVVIDNNLCGPVRSITARWLELLRFANDVVAVRPSVERSLLPSSCHASNLTPCYRPTRHPTEPQRTAAGHRLSRPVPPSLHPDTLFLVRPACFLGAKLHHPRVRRSLSASTTYALTLSRRLWVFM